MKELSTIHSYTRPRDVVRNGRLQLATTGQDAAEFATLGELSALGIHLTEQDVRNIYTAMGMDSAPVSATNLSPSVVVPIEFLRHYLPGFVFALTRPRMSDTLMGVTVAGSWEKSEIVQGTAEMAGETRLYGDDSNIPLANAYVNWEKANIARWELGFQMTELEEAVTAAARINILELKSKGVSRQFEILRNAVGLNGFQAVGAVAGTGALFGFLNAPGLPAYVQVAATGTGSTTQWANKTFLQIQGDLQTAIAALRTSMWNIEDLEKKEMTLALPISVMDFLNRTADFGQVSVKTWLQENYNVRVIGVPELLTAAAGSTGAYLYVENVDDEYSTDGGAVFAQLVPSRIRTIGVQKVLKGFVQGHGNALAGVMCKRPYAVYRFSGI